MSTAPSISRSKLLTPSPCHLSIRHGPASLHPTSGWLEAKILPPILSLSISRLRAITSSWAVAMNWRKHRIRVLPCQGETRVHQVFSILGFRTAGCRVSSRRRIEINAVLGLPDLSGSLRSLRPCSGRACSTGASKGILGPPVMYLRLVRARRQNGKEPSRMLAKTAFQFWAAGCMMGYRASPGPTRGHRSSRVHSPRSAVEEPN